MERIIRTLWALIHRNFRVCAFCGCPKSQDFIFCLICRDLLSVYSSHNDEAGVSSIWDWVPDASRPVSVLMSELKNHGVPQDWDFLAEDFLRRHLLDRDLKGCVLIPAPSQKDPNHARMFAEALSRTLKIPVFDVLRQTSAPAQKLLNRHERRRRRLSCHENFSLEELANQHQIFVDDILTTGATAESAWRALGRSSSFEVWTIARRQLATPDRLCYKRICDF